MELGVLGNYLKYMRKRDVLKCAQNDSFLDVKYPKL